MKKNIILIILVGLVQPLFAQVTKTRIENAKDYAITRMIYEYLKFSSSRTKEELIIILEDELLDVGLTEISNAGQIKINSTKFGGPFHKSKISGSIKEKDEKYLINFDYSSTLTLFGWIVFVVSIPVLLALAYYVYLWYYSLLSLLWFLLPIITKNKIKKAMEQSIERVRFEIK